MLRHPAHIIPCAGVSVSPSMDILTFCNLILHVFQKRRLLQWQRIAIRVVEETVVISVDFIRLFYLVFPLLLYYAMHPLLIAERAVVAMERHVAVGDIMAEDEKTHRYMVVGGSYRTSTVFLLQHLKIVDDAVGDRLATVSAVTLHYRI